MNENHALDARRLAGADAISSSAVEFGRESGVTIEKCSWDIGADLSHRYAHRLDLSTELKTVRLYFPDIELMKSEDVVRRQRVDTRLKSAIAQLISHVPAATYAFCK